MEHAHVEIEKHPRGYLRFPTWIFEKGENRTNFPVKKCKQRLEGGGDTLYMVTSSILSLVANGLLLKRRL